MEGLWAFNAFLWAFNALNALMLHDGGSYIFWVNGFVTPFVTLLEF